MKGPGDGTVPLLSAERLPSYLWPEAVTPEALSGDDEASHNGLMKNTAVWHKVDDFLDDGLLNGSVPAPGFSSRAAASTGATVERKRLFIFGVGYVKVRDAEGNENTKMGDVAAAKIPEVDIRYGGDQRWVIIECAADNSLTIEPNSPSDVVELEIIDFDESGAANNLNRYRFSPLNAVWTFDLAFAQTPALKVDLDGSGTLDSSEVVAPTHSISGGSVDTTQPSVSLMLSLNAGAISATVTGVDGDRPSPNLFYSLDNGPTQSYAAPLSLPADVATMLKVFAEDAAGNTSGLIETMINPNITIPGEVDETITLTWPMADAYILEESSNLTEWLSSSAQVTRNGFTDSASLPIDSDRRRFFRLRARSVTK